MIKFKRHINVNGESLETWLGLEIRKNNGKPCVSIYMYTGDPVDQMSEHFLIKGNFHSKDEAVKYGIQYVKDTYRSLARKQKVQVNNSEEDTDFDWDAHSKKK